MSSPDTGSRLIVALDFPAGDDAVKFAERLDPSLCRVKIGKELFTSAGPAVVEGFVKKGFDVFLDLKYHDIPNTVAKACAAARELGVWMMNVHTLGGPEMMQAARDALGQPGTDTPLLIGVTILTSHSQESIEAIGLSGPIADHVVRLAGLAKGAGLDGVVCSAREVTALRDALGQDFNLVTPGIRPASASTDDQKRVMTPRDAIKAGSDYLVVGRPVTQADDPVAVLQAINSDINTAL